MPTFATRCGGVLALWCLCAGLTAARAESVTLERDNVLRSEPRIEAATVAKQQSQASEQLSAAVEEIASLADELQSA